MTDVNTVGRETSEIQILEVIFDGFVLERIMISGGRCEDFVELSGFCLNRLLGRVGQEVFR